MRSNRSSSTFRRVFICGHSPLFPHRRPAIEKRRRPTAFQDAAALALPFLVFVTLAFTGCASAPRPQLQRPAQTFPADAFITQRGVLTTVFGKQHTLNGYLASSSTNGQRLIITENFGTVLADVLVKPDGSAHVMKASRAFKPKWIERYIAADVRCLFGNAPGNDCPGQMLSPTHFLIERRWYKLDLQILSIKPGPQPAGLFEAAGAESP